MTKTVAVTGATGFLGLAVCRALQADGFQTRAVVRRPAEVPGADQVRCAPLEPSPALTGALEGVSAIVHCAGGGRAITADDFLRNNLETTLALTNTIGAITEATSRSNRRGSGPLHLVLVSSISAGGPFGNTDETAADDRSTARSRYGESKWLAERAVRELANRFQGEVQVTIVRPPAIYGPGDDRMAPLFRAARRGWLLAPDPEAPLSMIDVEDAATAIVQVLARPRGDPRLYFLEDGERYSARRMGDGIARHFQRHLRIMRISPVILHGVAIVAEAKARVTGKSAFLTQDKVRDLTAPSWLCDASRLRAETPFRPRHTFESRIPEIAATLARQGLL